MELSTDPLQRSLCDTVVLDGQLGAAALQSAKYSSPGQALCRDEVLEAPPLHLPKVVGCWRKSNKKVVYYELEDVCRSNGSPSDPAPSS